MLRRTSACALAAAAAAALSLAGGLPAASASTTTAPADAAPAAEAATTITYNADQATEYEAEIAAGVQVWNDSVANVQIEEAAPGQRAEITIIATDGWPQATLGPVRPGGSARVEMGSQAVDEGHDVTRIAAHELGHSLGLPDIKPGPCSSLMSGSTAGTSCTNAVPNSAERSRVEQNYGTGALGQVPAAGTMVVDGP
ncbi:snapalysin family zinc-dependent metalloprotease [Nocardiopsis sediminis]|uniref:Extracellular small neutral protease n=1 Tax=Nocardiopsis sediminis TaxID=1778267 RepID=A0ABV8FTM8_9ACTN